jgi:thiol-disulfide isomerase/thioredoxin
MLNRPQVILRILVLMLLGFVLNAPGCGPSGPPSSPGGQSASVPSAPVSSGEEGSLPADEITLRVIDEHEFAEILAQKRGSPVLVDCWATWCLACLELFPHTLNLAEKWKDQGLVVISLSFDDPDDKDMVLERLRRFGAKIENYLVKYGASQRAIEAFDITYGALPHYKLYDREGKLYKVLASGGRAIRPETIDAAVEELLGK